MSPLGKNIASARNKKWWLCFKAEQGMSTIEMEHYGANAPQLTLETSVDNGNTWQSFVVDSTKITLPRVGDKVYFRAGTNGNASVSLDKNNENNFIMTGKISASGNIHSLLNSTYIVDVIPQYCYAYLFYNCVSLTSVYVPNATTFSNQCYINMLDGCTSLSKIVVYFKSFYDSNNNLLTNAWLNAAKSNSKDGIFYCPKKLGTQETIERDNVNKCPVNWTVLNI